MGERIERGKKRLRITREIDELEGYIRALELQSKYNRDQVKKARIKLATLKKEVLE